MDDDKASYAFLDAFEAADHLAGHPGASAALYAVKAAAYAVNAAHDAVTGTEADVADNAVWSAINAAKAGDCYHINLKDIILRDSQHIQAYGEIKDVDHGVELYGGIWDRFHGALCDINCGYWSDLYRNIFDHGFQLDTASLARRMSVPVEIRKQGAVAVAAYLLAHE
jgi:hypothetical protein